MIDYKKYKIISLQDYKKAYDLVEDLEIHLWEIKSKNKKGHIWQFENHKYYVEYFDIFFASYDIHIMKVERIIYYKRLLESIYWRAWFKIPPGLVEEKYYKNLGFNLPEAIDEVEFDLWLRLELVNENNWLFL